MQRANNLIGPFDCFLLLRGLKTLKLRMDAQQRSTAIVADFLTQHPKVSTFYYPGIFSHAGYAIQQAQARGGGAVLSFTVGSAESARKIAELCKLFRISVSFGSINSTISIPLKMSHASVPLELLTTRAIPDNLLRLSIGIEDPEDLVKDLEVRLNSI